MTTNGKIEVLVVEDSPAARLLIVHLLEASPRLRVIGTAASGEEALTFLAQHQPDAIVMDIHMPGINGYETTRRIMETWPVPIIVCSASLDPAEVANTFRALDAGALAVVPKPPGPGHPEHEAAAVRLIDTVTLMSEVKVVKRWPRSRRPGSAVPFGAPSRLVAEPCQVVAIGTSTGGPSVLQTILAGLPANFPVPVLIVQHIAAGFLPGLVDWLHQTTGFPVHIAGHGDQPNPGNAYLAPDGYHLGLAAGGRIALSRQPPENGLRPAVSYLFRSVAEVCGPRVIGVLLTGMGRDGAEELKFLKDIGAVTIAQDEESAIIHGMPGEAIRLGGAVHVMAPEKIPAALIAWTTLPDGRTRSTVP